MNFLIKIEEAINQLIIRFWTKLKRIIPQFIFNWITFIVDLPMFLKKAYETYAPIVRIKYLKSIGYIDHYFTILRGHTTSYILYVRSGKLKDKIKSKLVMDFFKTSMTYVKLHPIKMLNNFLALTIVLFIANIFYQNTSKIITGTRSSRNPASLNIKEENLFIDFLNHKFIIQIGSAQNTHKVEGSNNEHDIFLDIKIETSDSQAKNYLQKNKTTLKHNIEGLSLHAEQLPLTPENKNIIEEQMTLSLNKSFENPGRQAPIKRIVINQIIPARPTYYRQAERMLAVTDTNLQIFFENTQRNRQVWIDFSILTSNRNAFLYLQEHEVEFKDYLTNNIEPIIPQLPIEDEGRQIIKDKIKIELDDFLEKNNIEGKILEVYIEHLLVS